MGLEICAKMCYINCIMQEKKILKVAEECFVDYFGRQYRPLIEQRLGKTSFGLVNENNADKFINEYISDVNDAYNKNNLGSLGEDYKQYLTNSIKQISVPSENRGTCIFTARFNTSGNIVDARRGAFVNDATKTKYENTWFDSFTDMAICHELLHAVTMHIANNNLKSGIREEGDIKTKKMNELIINNMALDVAKKIHSHGNRFNERIAPSKSIYSSYMDYVKLRKLPASFFSNYKSILKPAMITGDYSELYNAFGNKEKFTEVCEYLNSL